MNYNTDRKHILMREYGRHVQGMVEFAVGIEDDVQRQYAAEAIIQMMGVLNPNLKNSADYKQKLWDHIFIISDFKLKVNSPFPIPTPENAFIKPSTLPYPQKRIKMKHYGRNVESMVKRAMEMEEDKKIAFTEIIGNFMKMAYKNWSNEEVSNDLVKGDMKSISGGALEISEEMNIETMTRLQRKKFGQGSNMNNNNNKNRNNKNRNNRNNKYPNNRNRYK